MSTIFGICFVRDTQISISLKLDFFKIYNRRKIWPKIEPGSQREGGGLERALQIFSCYCSTDCLQSDSEQNSKRRVDENSYKLFKLLNCSFFDPPKNYTYNLFQITDSKWVQSVQAYRLEEVPVVAVFSCIQFNCRSSCLRCSQKPKFSPKICKSKKNIFKEHFVNFSEFAWRDHVDDDVDWVHPTVPGVEYHWLKRCESQFNLIQLLFCMELNLKNFRKYHLKRRHPQSFVEHMGKNSRRSEDCVGKAETQHCHMHASLGMWSY